MDIKKLKAKAKQIHFSIQIGKAGITRGGIEEIKKQLKKNKLVKIKLLKSFVDGADRKQAAEELAQKTDSVLVLQIGNVIALAKK